MTALPSQDEVLGYFESLSNWGRWGPDDELGTLNLIAAEHRRAAAATVTEGVTVSCALDLSPQPAPGQLQPPQRHMLLTGEGLCDAHRVDQPVPGAASERFHGASEFIGMVFHGADITHVDALSHIFWDKRMYNGAAPELVNVMHGATRQAVTVASAGVVTRGVLIDVAALRGVEALAGGEGVTPADLEAAEERQGVRVGRGDAVLLRTGFGSRRRDNDPELFADGAPGWHASCLPWLHEREVALIACDTATDVVPSGYDEPPLPVHAVGIVAMGLWLLDNCDLEELAATAARLGRWEFLFTLAPLRLVGATGSPVNPLATF